MDDITKTLKLLARGNFCCLLITFANSLEKSTFSKKNSGIPSDIQTAWIQIRANILSSLIWVQTVGKGYQQTTLVGRELNSSVTDISHRKH